MADADISDTALHNHFFGEIPRIMYMHVYGMGEKTVLARGIRTALDTTKTPKPASAATRTTQPSSQLDS